MFPSVLLVYFHPSVASSPWFSFSFVLVLFLNLIFEGPTTRNVARTNIRINFNENLGEGDYTKDREQWLRGMNIKSIVKEIKNKRRKK
jgi:hypothetical protein